MLALRSRQNTTDLDTKRAIWVNAQLTRWFVSFAEFSCDTVPECDGRPAGRTDISYLAIPAFAWLAMLPLW